MRERGRESKDRGNRLAKREGGERGESERARERKRCFQKPRKRLRGRFREKREIKIK